MNYTPAEYVAFDAEDVLGVYCVADTTSKDCTASLWVVFDVSAL